MHYVNSILAYILCNVTYVASSCIMTSADYLYYLYNTRIRIVAESLYALVISLKFLKPI